MRKLEDQSGEVISATASDSRLHALNHHQRTDQAPRAVTGKLHLAIYQAPQTVHMSASHRACLWEVASKWPWHAGGPLLFP